MRAAERQFDTAAGGFGGAPKFPPHGTLGVLLAHHQRTGDAISLEMATETLDAMAKGGMYDLLAGGFSRYSVDAEWRVPHFEKMLYDNGQLIELYTDAWRVTGREHYARVVRETIEWALREMKLDHNGFAASQDADSDGREGSFFVWTPAELQALLGDSADTVGELLQVTETGTFEDGASVLRLEVPLEDLSPVHAEQLREAFKQLFEAREQRSRPGRDDKVVTSWNGLMISALARAGAAFNEAVWVDAAVAAAEFVRASCVVDGRLMRTFKDGRAHIPGYADDHVNVANALLDLWEATFDPTWLDAAVEMTERTVELFWDEEEGGLFYTGSDQAAVVHRSKHFIGGAEPAANGVAAKVFLRIGRLCGRDDLLEKAERIVRSAQALLSQAPRALGAEVLAGAWLAEGGLEVAVVGEPEDDATQALVAELRRHFLPFAVIYSGAEADERMPWLEGKEAVEGKPTAYVCEGYACLLPVQEPEQLREQLDDLRIRAVGPTSAPEARQIAPELPTEPERWLGVDEPPSLEALRGQIVVLDFWTSCCINCHHVLPELEEVEATYADAPVTVLGVHSAKFTAEKQRSNVEMALERHRVDHPVVLDSEHALWNAYGVRSWPTVVVIDPEGRIAAQRPGEITAGELGEIIDALMNEFNLERASALDAPEPPTAVPVPGLALRFPGKIHVWPDAWDQEMGARLGNEARVYISDSGNHRVIEATIDMQASPPRLNVLRMFGSGTPGLRDGAADQACFRSPQGVRRFQDQLYVADTENHALRMVDLKTGQVSTLAGNGQRGTTPPTREQLASPTEACLRSPWAVEVMPFRTHHIVFVAMAGSHQIWVYGGEHIGIHAGSGREDHVDGPAAAAALAQPSDLSLYGRYLLFADSEVSSIRAVDLQSHQVVTVVGRGLFDFGDVDGPADKARLQHPLGITFSGETVYVADTFNHKIRAIGLADGQTRTLTGGEPTMLRDPGGLARAGDQLLVADTSNHRIRAIPVNGGDLADVIVDFSLLAS